MKTDDIDLAIIRHLWDGRKPFSQIAKEIGVTTNTVRARVNKLIENGVLQIIGLVDPKAIPGHYSAIIGLKVEPKKVRQLVQKIGKLKGVVTVASVTGRFDIMAVVFFNELHSHRDFMLNELAQMDGVISMETFFTMDAVNWQLRYVL
ncbi:MAG: Lrp/AsnC family transcriptional regulator [Deltaproteobacteria bacterium]|nr:Lrp/AsnC family transcriptional regulator [Deltaproteobacteria bacterium]